MNFFKFLRGQMSEADGTPSNNRVMLFLFLTTVMLMLIGVAISPLFHIALKLPEIPASFETFVEIIVSVLVTGSVAGKGVNAYKAVKGANNEPESNNTGS